MKKILLTGGAGFIGSHVVKKLLQNNYSVTIFDDLSSGHKESIDSKAKFILGDITNPKEIGAALKDIDAVIHMAGKIVVPESVAKPVDYFNTNVYGGLILLEAMKKQKVNKIIFSSSAAVYGNPVNIPIDEDDPKNPTSPYGSSKLAFETFLSSYSYSYKMDCISLRYFNAYGPNENHKPETHAIPVFIKAALDDKPITITGDINQIRDFVYVEDIAQAHVDALKLSKLHAMNLGSGNGVSLQELVDSLENILNKKLKIENLPKRPGDPQKLVAKVDLIAKTLGWKPKISLKKGLTETISYFKSL